jgi:hypothetical protein
VQEFDSRKWHNFFREWLEEAWKGLVPWSDEHPKVLRRRKEKRRRVKRESKKGGREEGRKGGREEGRKGGREEGRREEGRMMEEGKKMEEGRKGGREKGRKGEGGRGRGRASGMKRESRREEAWKGLVPWSDDGMREEGGDGGRRGECRRKMKEGRREEGRMEGGRREGDGGRRGPFDLFH